MSGIYVHIPFCKSKCIYCAFYSTVNQRDRKTFINTLIQEIQLKKALCKEWKFNTIYFGGGTPSLLQSFEIERIITSLQNNLNISDLEEFTIEANPEQLSKNYCSELKKLGVNRVSIGVQSFDDSILKFLGRKHSAKEALNAIENVYDSGIENISVDLIYGINERDDSSWQNELQTLLNLPVKHFSAYALTLEENSILYQRVKNKRHEQLDEELAERQYILLIKHIQNTDFQQYEVSNFSKNGFWSKHNSGYWFGKPYIGFGPSAHSFDLKSRFWNSANLKSYISDIEKHQLYSDKEDLTTDDIFNEYVLLRLRTSKGIELAECAQLFGTEKVNYLKDYFAKSVGPNYYYATEKAICLTQKGFWFADGIAANAFSTD